MSIQHACVAMPRTVQLSEEAYATLAAIKRPGESFSDVVLRTIRSRKDPGALLRLGPRIPGYDHEKVREKMRRADLEKLRRLGLKG